MVEPDTHARLETAALDMFCERGYEQTTVLDIVQRAGVARRTFFRYFSTKREVMFWSADRLGEVQDRAVAQAPTGGGAFALARQAVMAVCDVTEPRAALVHRRQLVIVATVELQERDLFTRAELARGLAAALRTRDVAPLASEVTATAVLNAFGVSFAQWAATAPRRGGRTLRQHADEALDALRESLHDSPGGQPGAGAPVASGRPVTRRRASAAGGR